MRQPLPVDQLGPTLELDDRRRAEGDAIALTSLFDECSNRFPSPVQRDGCGRFRIARILIEHDLVDELRLKIFPIVLGAGERLFGETSGTKALRLVDVRTLDGDTSFLTFERVQDGRSAE
jgi:hypothetical protein